MPTNGHLIGSAAMGPGNLFMHENDVTFPFLNRSSSVLWRDSPSPVDMKGNPEKGCQNNDIDVTKDCYR